MALMRDAKDETGKLPLARVFREFAPALLAVAKLTEFGRTKYGKTDTCQHNKNGVETYYTALLRHLMDFLQGEEVDPESGLSHSTAVAWYALAALWHVEKRGNEEAPGLVSELPSRQASIGSELPYQLPPLMHHDTRCNGCGAHILAGQTHCAECGVHRTYRPL